MFGVRSIRSFIFFTDSNQTIPNLNPWITDVNLFTYVGKVFKNEIELLDVENYFKNTNKNIFEYSKLKFTFAFLK